MNGYPRLRFRGTRLDIFPRTHLHGSKTALLKRAVRFSTRSDIETTFDRLSCGIQRSVGEDTHSVMLALATASFCSGHRENFFNRGKSL